MGLVNGADGYSAVFTEHHLALVRLGFLLCGDRPWAEDLSGHRPAA